MAGKIPKSVTVEEAVALIIGLELFVEDVTLEEMLQAFIDSNQEEYDNTNSEKEKKLYAYRAETCINRLELAKTLHQNLLHELEHIDEGMESDIELSSESVGKNRITTNSLRYWAIYNFGIEVLGYRAEEERTNKDYSWGDITISLRADHKIQVLHKGKVLVTKFLHEIGLKGINRSEPNHSYGILLGLAQKMKYPKKPSPTAAEKTQLSKLDACIQGLVGISGKSFHSFNETSGYLPKFKLVDARNAANERAEKEAIHVTYNDEMANTQEPDEADKFLADNE